MTQRRAAEIRGVVQGVGFRPFVARIAEELAVTGTVANTSGSVALEIEGPARALDRFSQRMLLELPEAARIDELRWWRVPPVGDARFTIAESQRGDVALAIPPDLTVCAACLAEIDAPGARRRGYPFTNCTRCGPRFTITRAPPYDRARTSMAAFPMCDACAAEYRDPSDRR
ncbi:MAG: acylphosphatase, partial [Myxococcales bacterium]|nr:acylphosphatase [Myxococcales bacterium]